VRDERIGLRIMRERADSVGGCLHIESSVGEGTEIQVEVPRFRSSQLCRC
jgi:signal transduction histidine kinase